MSFHPLQVTRSGPDPNTLLLLRLLFLSYSAQERRHSDHRLCWDSAPSGVATRQRVALTYRHSNLLLDINHNNPYPTTALSSEDRRRRAVALSVSRLIHCALFQWTFSPSSSSSSLLLLLLVLVSPPPPRPRLFSSSSWSPSSCRATSRGRRKYYLHTKF